MALVFRHISVGIRLLLLVAASIGMRGPNVLQRDVPDWFDVYSHMPHIVAISDSNNDTIFECESAIRTHIDPKSREVTYVATLDGHHGTQKRKVAFYVTGGPTPNTIVFTSDEHPDVQDTGEIIYTNHRNCFVVQFTYSGEECILYVSKNVVDNVPQDCIDQFGDICGVATSQYSRDLCPDDEDF